MDRSKSWTVFLSAITSDCELTLPAFPCRSEATAVDFLLAMKNLSGKPLATHGVNPDAFSLASASVLDFNTGS
jgi:hypothetical protein